MKSRDLSLYYDLESFMEIPYKPKEEPVLLHIGESQKAVTNYQLVNKIISIEE